MEIPVAGKLVLCRHGQSKCNLENKFTGWEDVDLTQLGEEEAQKAEISDKIEEIIDSRTSDAIALAIRFKSPIFTYESVLEKAGIIIKAGGEKVKKESDKSKKVDLNKMSIKQIKNAIEVAVKNEDYELAAQLRDKLTEKNE